MENRKLVEVRRKAGRFQLIRREIERLATDGVYRFVDERDKGKPMVWEATRDQLEQTFAQAMSTPSYRVDGVFHQDPWPLADPYRIA